MKTINVILSIAGASMMSVANAQTDSTQTPPVQSAPAPVTAPVVNKDTKSEKRKEVIDKREARQEKRIEQGEKSGQLTPTESAKLEKKQDQIKKMEVKADADGHISKKEFKAIEKKQNRASKIIARKKHNSVKN